MQTTMVAIVAALALTGPLDERRRGDVVEIELSRVFLIKDLPAPAREAGVLKSMRAKAGDHVRAGDVIAQIDDALPQLEKRAAERERIAALALAEDDIDVRYARESAELAKEEFENTQRINARSQGTIARSEVRRMELAASRASLHVGKSELDQRVAQLNADKHLAAVEAANEKIQRHVIKSPFDGIIVDVFKQENGWVNAGEAVVRIVRLDRLYVDGFISAADYDPHEVMNKQVTVEVALARGRKLTFPGEVVFVNPQIQAGNRYRLRAEVQNRKDREQWILWPGKDVTTFVHLR
ncbi:MAG: HlyD family efflux transporter periplasmic adaptor subunit [Pirellulaceae bacterium]|jgi:macrolide-specific efflux system membrane fusion protein|nr:HlyD family efflux transporter periplasmic adaptor subunit [Pirellulaceae bacterium]MDP7016913.1 HlyD family efflux transporter periplasmic adaptor subunit [Pirellulaceae bacterium]